jgi:hypothetical protein
MRSFFVYISSRLKQMPFALHVLALLCIFAPIFAFGFYYRGELPGGLPKVLLTAIGSAVFVYGLALASWTVVATTPQSHRIRLSGPWRLLATFYAGSIRG